MRKGRVTDTSVDTSWGVTSHTPHTADAQRLLRINRGHWTIENSLHRILDGDNWNEDNSRIRTGHGPENMTGLRRFAIGVIKMHGKPVAATVRKLHRTPRLLLDYLKMSANTRPSPPSPDTDAAAHDRTQPARKASALREPSPVPGTPRHKPENPRKPRPTPRPQTPSRVIHAHDEHPSRAMLLSDIHPQQNKNLPWMELR